MSRQDQTRTEVSQVSHTKYKLSRLTDPPSIWTIVMILVVFGIGMSRSNDSKSLSLEKLNITSKDGKVKASLGVNEQGIPRLHLYDNLGKERVAIALTDDGSPSIVLAQENDKLGIAIKIQGPNESSIQIGQPEHQSNINLHVKPNGQAGIGIRDGGNNSRAVFALTSDSKSIMSLQDSNRVARIHLQHGNEGSGMIVNSADSVPRVLIGENQEKISFLAINDLKGQVRSLVRYAPETTSGFFQLNEDNQTVFSVTEQGTSSQIAIHDQKLGLDMGLGNLRDGSLGGFVQTSAPNVLERLVFRANQFKSSLELTSPDGKKDITIDAVNARKPLVDPQKPAEKGIERKGMSD